MATKASLIADAKQRMHTSLETVRRELAAMRTGRASLSMLDGVRVDYYGNPTPLNEMAILTSVLDLYPQNDGKIIRIPVPSLTEERRKTLVKHALKHAEEGRVAVRNVRRD